MELFLKNILNKINDNKYSAYVVGGYVRDKLLGIDSYDIDISTDMPFDELKKIFLYDIIYPSFYSLKFKMYEYSISITTFRKELLYEDNRPIKLCYTNDINIDSSRRDFTINAIYLDKDENYIDLYNGIDDIKNQIINVIGDVNVRFREDKTRILRALRFMSILNFELSDEIKDFILNNKNLIKEISYEKKKEEIDKIFKSGKYIRFLKFIKDNDLESSFEIYVGNINIYDNYLDVWKSLKVSDNYIFSKKEINYLLNNN